MARYSLGRYGQFVYGVECWKSLTQRLLSYFAKPFKTDDDTTLLGRYLASVARELSNCTQEVTLSASEDARGNGTFTLITRFGPILGVSAVNRVDSNGNVLESYTVTGFDENTITLSGTKAPGHGDFLQVSYTYLFGGLEYQVEQALLELNILTATGSFLDSWGRWFGVPRLPGGKYGAIKYGGATYGSGSTESDTSYSRRIIARVTQRRNTPNAIVAVVTPLSGPPVYCIDWLNNTNPIGWIYNVNAAPTWSGGFDPASQSKHLIWGLTSRFVNPAATDGGICTFEVLVPSSSPYTLMQLLQVINQYKAAGTRCFVRYITPVAAPPEAPGPLGATSP